MLHAVRGDTVRTQTKMEFVLAMAKVVRVVHRVNLADGLWALAQTPQHVFRVPKTRLHRGMEAHCAHLAPQESIRTVDCLEVSAASHGWCNQTLWQCLPVAMSRHRLLRVRSLGRMSRMGTSLRATRRVAFGEH